MNPSFRFWKGILKGSKEERLADFFDIGSVVIALGAIVLGVSSSGGYISGTFRYSTVVAVVAGYLTASLALKRKSVGIQRVFLGFACVGCGLAIYTTIYRYSFISTLKYIPTNLVYLQSHSYNLGVQYSIPLALLSIAIPFVGYKMMSLNKWFCLSLISTMALFLIWILIGYPQDFGGPGQFFVTPLIAVDPLASQTYALGFETATNFTALLIPAALFLGKDRGARGQQSHLHENLASGIENTSPR